MKKPIFSIIIPAFNEEKYLAGCLESLSRQDFPKDKYEIIVVNNGSTDKTKAVAEKFAVKLINEPKKGVIFARQKGFKKARGKYIVNTDADCLLPKNWLKTIYKNFKQNKNIIAVAGPTKSNGQDLFSQYILKMASKVNTWSFKYRNSVLAIWAGNIAIKKTALKKIGGYNTSLPQFADQLELHCQLKKTGKIYFNKDLIIQESDRRYKNRLLSFLIKDCFYYNFLGYQYYKLTGRHFGQWRDFR